MTKSVYVRLDEVKDKDILNVLSQSPISNPQLFKAFARFAIQSMGNNQAGIIASTATNNAPQHTENKKNKADHTNEVDDKTSDALSNLSNSVFK